MAKWRDEQEGREDVTDIKMEKVRCLFLTCSLRA